MFLVIKKQQKNQKEYYKNGDIKYDGDFVNDVYEGKGKYIFENGKYYIGQWLNGKANGKYNYENGEYYKGQFKNGLRHGKGKLYYKNGNVIYDGDYINK